jgi:hypothetical protein
MYVKGKRDETEKNYSVYSKQTASKWTVLNFHTCEQVGLGWVRLG